MKRIKNITPIKGCAWQRPDRSCFHEDNLTPECHVGICPRLAPHIGDALDVYADMLDACKQSLRRFEFLAQQGMIQADDVQYLRDVISKAEGRE